MALLQLRGPRIFPWLQSCGILCRLQEQTLTQIKKQKQKQKPTKTLCFVPQKNVLTSFKATEFILLWSPISRFHVVYHIPAQTKRRGGCREKRRWILHFKHQTEKNQVALEGRQILHYPSSSLVCIYHCDRPVNPGLTKLLFWFLNSISFIPALTLITTVFPLYMGTRHVPSCSRFPTTNWLSVVCGIVLSSNNKTWNFLLKL